jgi:hypothetical protein
MKLIDSMFEDIHQYGGFFDVIYEIKQRDYSVSELRKIFDKLPLHIKDQAQIWGISDTVVKDDAYEFLMNHPELIEG